MKQTLNEPPTEYAAHFIGKTHLFEPALDCSDTPPDGWQETELRLIDALLEYERSGAADQSLDFLYAKVERGDSTMQGKRLS